jgi:hypothetical protein
MTNRIRAEHLSTGERLDEIAEIFALGLIRIRQRQSSALSAHHGECSLDCAGHQSGHSDPNSLEVEA